MSKKNNIGQGCQAAAALAEIISNINTEKLVDMGYDYFNDFVCANTECDLMTLRRASEFVYDTMDTDTDFSCTEHILDEYIEQEGLNTEGLNSVDYWEGWDKLFWWAHDIIMKGAEKGRAECEAEDDENMNNIVAEHQAEFDELVGELENIAPSYSAMTSKLQHLRAYAVIKKLVAVAEKCLEKLGEYTQCDMGEDDGWHVDTTAFAEWIGGYGKYDAFTINTDEINSYAVECLDTAMWEDRVIPMTEDEFNEFVWLTEKTDGHANTDYTDYIGVDWDTFDRWQQVNWDTLADMAVNYNNA